METAIEGSAHGTAGQPEGKLHWYGQTCTLIRPCGTTVELLRFCRLFSACCGRAGGATSSC